MDSEAMPNTFSQEVTTKDGVVKLVVAQSQAELDEAVAAIKNDALPVAPDILNPEDGNKIVSPDNLPVEPPYVQPPDPDSIAVVEEEVELQVNRDAGTGRFVDDEAVEESPKTTVTETVKKSKK